MKECISCDQELNLKCFAYDSKNKTYKDICKECFKLEILEDNMDAKKSVPSCYNQKFIRIKLNR